MFTVLFAPCEVEVTGLDSARINGITSGGLIHFVNEKALSPAALFSHFWEGLHGGTRKERGEEKEDVSRPLT